LRPQKAADLLKSLGTKRREEVFILESYILKGL